MPDPLSPEEIAAQAAAKASAAAAEAAKATEVASAAIQKAETEAATAKTAAEEAAKLETAKGASEQAVANAEEALKTAEAGKEAEAQAALDTARRDAEQATEAASKATEQAKEAKEAAELAATQAEEAKQTAEAAEAARVDAVATAKTARQAADEFKGTGDKDDEPLPIKVTLPPSPSDLRSQVPQTVAVTETPMPALQRHGVRLAWGVLALICIFGILLIIMVGINEFASPPTEITTATKLVERSAAGIAAAASGPEAIKQANDLLTRVAEARRASRDFWTSFAQFLLLNLLLPVLTAILGYVFGTMKAKDDSNGS